VAIVNETMARYYFGKENPLGRCFGFGGRKKTADIEIVGVVKGERTIGLREEIPRFVYLPYKQDL